MNTLLVGFCIALEAEVNVLGHSIEKMRVQISEGNVDLVSEIEELESDASILRDAMVASPGDLGKLVKRGAKACSALSH